MTDDRLLRRSPEDQDEAWLAGMILTDGSVGWSGRDRIHKRITLAQAAIHGDLLTRMAERFGVVVRPGHNGLSSQKQCLIHFYDKPIFWKTEVPTLTPDLERHYWRGVIDGDGSLTYSHGKLSLRLYWLTPDQDFVGAAFENFLSRLGFGYGVYNHSNGQDRRLLKRLHVRIGDSSSVARLLYEDSFLAIPRKKERALA